MVVLVYLVVTSTWITVVVPKGLEVLGLVVVRVRQGRRERVADGARAHVLLAPL